MRPLICLLRIVVLAGLSTLAAREPLAPAGPVPPDGLIVLTFDDSCASHARHVAPLLRKHGFGATFFITEGFQFVRDKQNFMTWEEIKQLDEEGFEIGNHTRRHRGVAGLSPDQLLAEIVHIEKKCAEHGIAQPTSFCYPGYQTSEATIQLLRSRGYNLARAGGSEAFDPARHEPLTLPQAFDGKPESTLEDFKAAVAKARDGKIAVMTFHGVPDEPHPWLSTAADKFDSYLQHLADQKCKVVALRDIGRYLPRQAADDAPAFDWSSATNAWQKHHSGETLSAPEQALLAEARRRRREGERPTRDSADSTRGDVTDDRTVRNVHAIAEQTAPVKELLVASPDGHEVKVAYRTPPGDGPFPAILFFHGGMAQRPIDKLIHEALHGRTHNEFLRHGFVAVTASYRKYDTKPTSRGPIEDAAAAVRAVAALPQVDSKSIAVYGGSGGGSICLDLASEKDLPLAAVVAGEPATVIYTGMLTSYAKRAEVMDAEVSGYTQEIRARTEAKIASIIRPVLIHHGDQHALKHINYTHVIPAIRAAGKELSVETYPGENHGFYWGSRITPDNFEKLIGTTLEFLKPNLATRPTPWVE